MANLNNKNNNNVSVLTINHSHHHHQQQNQLSHLLQQTLKKQQQSKQESNRIDFLFLDHDKDMYLSDLIQLEQNGFIGPGTTVVADNVIVAQIDDYCHYVRSLEQRGIVQTETIIIPLEYSSETTTKKETGTTTTTTTTTEAADADIGFMDGIEITTYLQYPTNIKFTE